jgi:hypothetical protein
MTVVSDHVIAAPAGRIEIRIGADFFENLVDETCTRPCAGLKSLEFSPRFQSDKRVENYLEVEGLRTFLLALKGKP